MANLSGPIVYGPVGIGKHIVQIYADRLYANGGLGRDPSGSRHVDLLGSKACW
jgi:hypothetical protein